MFKKSSKLEEPWRGITWEVQNEDYHDVTGYKPRPGLEHLRVLLYGPPGSGKSSFINSVDSAVRGRLSTRAAAATGYDGSFTSRYRGYRIQKKTPGEYYPFVFSDTMGLQKDSKKGLDLEKLNLILNGHINEGYKFEPGRKPDGSFYNKYPTISDKVHVLVYVVSATTTNMMADDIFHTTREVNRAAEDLGIPQIAVLTQIDAACPVVKKKIQNVYRSKFLMQQMEKLSVSVGIPLCNIFPVQNYSMETKTDQNIDNLTLNAMKMIINAAEDFVNDYMDRPRPEGNQRGPPPQHRESTGKKFLPKQQ